MIVNVPKAADFQGSGVTYMGMAWSYIIGLIRELELSGMKGYDEELDDAYWQAANQPMAAALGLAQQGIELLIKARIAEVSPYLLITGPPRQWPRGSQSSDTSFSEFHTIDAQDLVRVFDTVCSTRLPDRFKKTFGDLRRLRNTVFHTVDKSLRIDAKKVLVAILEAVYHLIPEADWLAIRRDHLVTDHISVVYTGEHADKIIVRELETALGLLTATEAKRLLGYSKRKRSYICLTCTALCRDSEGIVRFAQLVAGPRPSQVHCVACGTTSDVLRFNCFQADCKSNVLDAATTTCLTCFRGGSRPLVDSEAAISKEVPF